MRILNLILDTIAVYAIIKTMSIYMIENHSYIITNDMVILATIGVSKLFLWKMKED